MTQPIDPQLNQIVQQVVGTIVRIRSGSGKLPFMVALGFMRTTPDNMQEACRMAIELNPMGPLSEDSLQVIEQSIQYLKGGNGGNGNSPSPTESGPTPEPHALQPPRPDPSPVRVEPRESGLSNAPTGLADPDTE